MHSTWGVEFTEYRARQRYRRTKARQSENVAAPLWYQAVTGTGICPPPLNCRASTVTNENRANRLGVVRAIAWSDHWRWVSSPRWARLSSNVTSRDQRMTTHSRICSGVACRSVQENASTRNWPSGADTSTYQRATGGSPGVYHRTVREKTRSFLRWPQYQVTSTVSQGVSLRLAQPCKLRWRLPLMGLGPRLPWGCGPGG